ncbi:MAG: ATP-binding protein, partial [Christensenellales bacterium]
MARINILDKSVYNLISAGEVVERPASVVKELVENSIDAGASEIIVSIEEGGLSKIVVVDNGSGIDREDMNICYLPHTTSKIAKASDLDE